MTMPSRLRRRRGARIPAAITLLLAGVLSACGPSVPIDAGMQQQAVNVGFGRQHPPTPAPTPPQALPHLADIVPNFPAPLAVPPLSIPELAQAPSFVPPPACPSAPATSFPAVPADLVPTTPPAQGLYSFRYTATETTGGKTTVLPATGTRRITNVSAVQQDGSYTFDVVETYNGKTVTTTYHVVTTGQSLPAPPEPPQQTLIASPSPSPPPPQNSSLQAGLFLQRMVDGGTDFQPTPEVLLMPFPAQQSVVFQGGGVDGSTRAAMEEDPQGGTITDRVRVDACGTVLDSWQAVIHGHTTDARDPSNQNDTAKTFTLTIDVGTQFGGLILADHLVESGTDDQTLQPFGYDVAATIDSAPPQQGTP